jgi:hypothetical protein
MEWVEGELDWPGSGCGSLDVIASEALDTFRATLRRGGTAK